ADRLADDDLPTWYLFGALVAQNLAIVLALVWVSDRKGQRSLRRDFGLRWPGDGRSVGAVIGWLGAGAGLSVLAALLLRPIADLAGLDDSAQQVSKTVEEAGGIGLVLLLVGIVVVAPVVEELLFRGALLRALQRRVSVPVAVFLSAAIFAGVHVVGDPGSYAVVPGLLLLGLCSGWQAARTGDLGVSVLLHMGFNLLSAVSLVLA
ncbi:MAG: lysostaphin resistance A-like protein, partial [Actinomycetota bacterium]